MRWRTLVGLGALGLFTAVGCGKWSDTLACGDDGCLWTDDEWARVTSLAGLPEQEPPVDLSNRYLLEPAARELGHKLYFDPRLSGIATWVDSLGRPAPNTRAERKGDLINVSCATCHDPARFGADFTSTPGNVSVGAGWYDVNAQQTLNAAFFRLLYWNGRTDATWAQAAQVIESGVSMNGDRLNTFRIIATFYRDDYTAIFCGDAGATDEGCPLPPPGELATDRFPPHGKPGTPAFDVTVADPRDRLLVTRVHVNASKAIAAYERSLRSGRCAFDRYVSAGPASGQLTPAAERGLKLFIGRASCISCHNTPLLSDQRFHDIGIPQRGESVPTVAACAGNASSPGCDCTGANGGARDDTCLPWGAYAGALRREASHADDAFSRESRYSDERRSPIEAGSAEPCLVAAADAGGDGGPTPDERCKAAWRTPSLRDVAMTAPYMHDGAFETLSDVVWHYDQADGVGSELSPLNLSRADRDDLVVFLQSLTGDALPPEITARPDLPGATTTEPGRPDGGADPVTFGAATGGER